MYVILEHDHNDGRNTTAVASYKRIENAEKNVAILESHCNIDDGMEYEIVSVPLNLNMEIE